MAIDMDIAVGLFPGQGGYKAGCLDRLLAESEPRSTLEAIDEVAFEMLGRRLLDTVVGADAPNQDELFATHPEILQIATFAASVALFDALSARGVRLTVLLGHSLGEIAALVCSGALTVTEGARILCHRVTVLREYDTSGGAMLALGCDRTRAEQILALLPSSDATIAVDNGAAQTALSGTADALRRIEIIAGAIGVPVNALRSPHPFHNALLQPARQELLVRIRGHRSHGLRVPVFSPILGRYYREQDDLGELLASHLVSPVEFGSAIGRAHASGARIWVEVGAGRALTSLVRSAYPHVALFTPLRGPATAISEAAAFLNGAASLNGKESPDRTAQPPVRQQPVVAVPAPVAADPVPNPAPAESPAGQTLSRTQIEQQIRDLYASALEYPEEVFEPDAELEADLGVDSVKQTELMTRLGEVFALGPRPEGMRVSDYRTFGKVVDFVSESLLAGSAAR